MDPTLKLLAGCMAVATDLQVSLPVNARLAYRDAAVAYHRTLACSTVRWAMRCVGALLGASGTGDASPACSVRLVVHVPFIAAEVHAWSPDRQPTVLWMCVAQRLVAFAEAVVAAALEVEAEQQEFQRRPELTLVLQARSVSDRPASVPDQAVEYWHPETPPSPWQSSDIQHLMASTAGTAATAHRMQTMMADGRLLCRASMASSVARGFWSQSTV